MQRGIAALFVRAIAQIGANLGFILIIYLKGIPRNPEEHVDYLL